MSGKRHVWPVLLLALGAQLSSPPAVHGYIERIYPFADILKETTHIAVGKLESVDVKARTAVAVLDRALKGELEYPRVLINLGLGPGHHADYIVRQIGPGEEFILFYRRSGANIAALAHSGGIWFQIYATDRPQERAKVWWRMTHVEIRMNRSFNGPTAQLVELTENVLAKRVEPPPPDPKVAPIDIDKLSRPAEVAIPAGKSGGFWKQVQFVLPPGGECRGIAWADLNGDGLPDFIACREKGNVLFANRPNGFLDDTSRAGLTGASRAAGWADFDGDGHPDLLTGDFRLFANVGGILRDGSAALAAPPQRNHEGAGWIDFDGDGRPDILITNGEHGIRLYRNTGEAEGRFVDVSETSGLGPGGAGNANGDFVVCFDYDGDGRADLFYNVGEGLLLRNDGEGRFRPVADNGGIRMTSPGTKRGVAAADYDHDGDLDLFVPGPGRAQLYRNNNDGTFTDVIEAAGDLAAVTDPSFAAAWGDVNCDGFLDLFVCHPGGPARLYLGDGQGKFIDVSEQTGVKSLAGAQAASFADVDGDGDLDLVVNRSDRVTIAINQMERPEGGVPLTVRVNDMPGLVGATVRVFDPRGRLAGMRTIGNAEGCGGQAWAAGHFGLAAGVCRVSVALSDGRAAEREVEIKDEPLSLLLAAEEFR